MTEKLMVYALGRGLEATDAPAVRKIKRDAHPGELSVRIADSGDCDEHSVYNEDGAGVRVN